jgi:hypothetical protein
MMVYYWKVLACMMQGPKPNVILLEKEALPWLPWVFQRPLFPSFVSIVRDYDDPLFHRCDRQCIAEAFRKLRVAILGLSNSP